jgi:hypothetical protein
MNCVLRLGIAIAILVTVYAAPAHAGSNDASFTISIGEAFMPSDLRFGYGAFDLGLGAAGLYTGAKVFKGPVYTGAGIGYANSSLATYGMLGYRAMYLGWLALSAEFFGVGTFKGNVSAHALLGAGVVW